MRATEYDTIWLYDDVCALCNWAVQFTLAHEKTPSIKFIAIQSDQGRALALRHGLNPDDPDSFALIEHGRVHFKSDGVIALAHHLQSPYSWLAALKILPRPLRDLLYERVAKNRYGLFGKREHCAVPSPDQRDRFVI